MVEVAVVGTNREHVTWFRVGCTWRLWVGMDRLMVRVHMVAVLQLGHMNESQVVLDLVRIRSAHRLDSVRVHMNESQVVHMVGLDSVRVHMVGLDMKESQGVHIVVLDSYMVRVHMNESQIVHMVGLGRIWSGLGAHERISGCAYGRESQTVHMVGLDSVRVHMVGLDRDMVRIVHMVGQDSARVHMDGLDRVIVRVHMKESQVVHMVGFDSVIVGVHMVRVDLQAPQRGCPHSRAEKGKGAHGTAGHRHRNTHAS
ncbi:hypothetical protein BgiBS90_035208 [Biomphalaria glabrata]|nr:hypothetical protein BgiBS90_035208 [Biomphalaria glabrata]